VKITTSTPVRLNPQRMNANRVSVPEASSTKGYLAEIGALQLRQRARNTIQDTTGRLSYQRMGVWHLGQEDGGRYHIEISRGTR